MGIKNIPEGKNKDKFKCQIYLLVNQWQTNV